MGKTLMQKHVGHQLINPKFSGEKIVQSKVIAQLYSKRMPQYKLTQQKQAIDDQNVFNDRW